MDYDIHVTRWERDAQMIIRLHAMKADELLRVHVMGGSGTLSEAISGVINMPNLQVAAYPMGNENIFLRYFGVDKLHLFSSIRSQVFSNTTPIDAIRCGHRYGLCQGLAGFEAATAMQGLKLYESKKVFSQSLAHFLAAVRTLYGSWILGQEYKINIDDQHFDGTYVSILIANGPVYAKYMNPAVDAHPNDGLLDIYLFRKISRFMFFFIVYQYLKGNHKKISHVVSHYRGTKISLSSENTMNLLIDDKAFYENYIEYEILPYAIDFICPGGVDIDKLPRTYGKADKQEV
jgi:diacylglycerol kinase family enzyme